MWKNAEASSKPSQTFRIECFAKAVNAKRFMLDVWQGSEYTSKVGSNASCKLFDYLDCFKI